MQIAPAIAWKANSRISIGATLNIAVEQVAVQQTFGGSGLNLVSPSSAYGVGATLGVMYKPDDVVTIGAVYKSAIQLSPLTWQETTEFVPTGVGPNGPTGVSGGPGQYSSHLNYPQQFSIGVAIRPVPRWLISVEGQWINWRATLNNFTISGPWNGVSSVSLPTHWQNEWVANIGVQHDVNKWLQVRAGYAYGSNPIRASDTAANLLFPAVVENALTFGATQRLGMGWKLTETYMHSFGNTITGGTILPGLPLQNTSSTLSENSYGLQIGYIF